MLCLVSFLQVQAQDKYYVALNNGTYQALTIADTHQMEFDADQKLVAIKLTDGTTSQFATSKVDSISLVQPAGATELRYNGNFNVAFDENDKNSYNAYGLYFRRCIIGLNPNKNKLSSKGIIYIHL